MRNLFLFIPIILLFACNSKNEKLDDNLAADKTPDTAAKMSHVKLGFEVPERIDTSEYVLYKLILGKTGTENESEYGSSSRSYVTNYWNMLFYNTVNGNYHLLNENRKMLISVSNEKNENESDANIRGKYIKSDTLMFYFVTVCDFNKDGKLDSEDPDYLFSSNKKGYNFKQLSPDSLHVKSWQILRSSGKILIQTVKDTNHDGKFNDDDESISYVYNLKTGEPAKEVFTNDFKGSINYLQNKLWPKKKGE